MSAVVIVVVGSYGDVAPLTGVGVRLRQAGHNVVIVAYERFGDLITGCGLRFRAIPEPGSGEGEPGADVDVVKGFTAYLAPSGMSRLGSDILAALRNEPADILLLSPFAELAGHPLAEAKGIPAVGVRLQPLSATAAHPPAVLGAWSAGAVGNRFVAGAGAWTIDRLYGRVVAGFRRELGLPKTSGRILRRRRTRADWTVLHGYSPIVAPRPRDWRPGLEVTGYWWPAPRTDWRPPDTLVDFLAAGPAPVFIGLGSTMIDRQRAEQLTDILRRALRKAHARGVVQAGWAGLDVTDDDVLTVGDVPHDWLFPRMAAVAHHCGAGTAAAGLRAGVPTIAMPGLGDQPFWARRLRELGASAMTVPQRSVAADRLADAIRATVTDGQFGSLARYLAGGIAKEDGAGRVLATIESVLQSTPKVPHGR